jgi:1,4-alpha-glucan branching enzyme
MASKQIQSKQQVFSITAPTAQKVMLAGDFTQWQEKAIQLKKEPTGVWRTSVELTPGTHRYRFIVDGQWCDDPSCTLHEPNPYGSSDAVVRIQ